MNYSNMDCAILVMSCDAYSDLWRDFFTLKKRFWPDCPFPTYLVTNNKEYEGDSVETICCGDQLNWTGRLNYALNKTKTPYVLLMLEDYYISGNVDERIYEVIDYIKAHNVAYYKLEERTRMYAKPYKGEKYLKHITKDVEYGISLLTSIWEVDFLKTVLNNEDYTAWEFEIRRNLKDDIAFSIDRLCLCDGRNILNIEHMVQRGKYLRTGLRKMQAIGYPINYSVRGKLSILTSLYLLIHPILRNNAFIFNMIRKVTKILGIKTISEKYASEISENSQRYK